TKTHEQSPQGGGGIWGMDENQSSDDGIELAIRGERIELGRCEAYIAPSGRGCAPFGDVERLLRPIDAQDCAGRTDQIGCEQRNVADTAADVEHLHARCESCATENVLGEIPEQVALELEAAEFAVRVAQRIRARFHGGR